MLYCNIIDMKQKKIVNAIYSIIAERNSYIDTKLISYILLYIVF